MILDVRNNPGGLLTQAIQVSDLFLSEGVIVYTDGRLENQKQKFFASGRGTEPDYPIVVLINEGSASASEILAGALKDHGRGLILGTQSFGKGSVQTITPLENGGALTLTTALYYTKSGNSIQATGVTPDIEVELEEQEQELAESATAPKRSRRRIREGDLPGAIENPSGLRDKDSDGALKRINKTPSEPDVWRLKPESVDLNEWYARDAQMERAVDLLKTFAIFESRQFSEAVQAAHEASKKAESESVPAK